MIELSDDQAFALVCIDDWYQRQIGAAGRMPGNRDERLALNRALTLGGYAGTGKTTLLGLLKDRIPALRNLRIHYCSYTGKAVSVLQNKLPAGTECTTLHRLLYHPQPRTVCKTSGEPCTPGELCEKHRDVDDVALCETIKKLDFTAKMNPLWDIDLVVADEASMISDKVWNDLTQWGKPVLAVGDHGQLPPIKSEFSLMENPQIKLERILRQVKDSPIIKMSIEARTRGGIRFGDYGQGCVKIPRSKMANYEIDPDNGDLIIVGYNRTRNELNTQMRALLGRSGPPGTGDIVICLRNSYENGIFNGMRGRIKELEPADDEGQTAWAVIEMLDEGFDYAGRIHLPQFGKPKTDNTVPRWLTLWDYGYALTCHKAQGSQADRVMVIEERLPQTDHKRWLYTAVTRAAKELIVVGH
jgi:exodeoxyribonuclease-5